MRDIVLHLITPFARLYAKWDKWYSQRQYEKRWKLEYQTELNALDQSDRANDWYALIVKNQMNHLRMEAAALGASSPNMDLFLRFRIGCAAARHFGVLTEIVGVQPLTSAVGLVYQLACNETQEGGVRLEVVKHAVEAGSRRLHTRWNMDAVHTVAAHTSNPEEELVAVLGSQIAYEVIAEVIGDLLTLAKQNEDNVGAYTIKNGTVAINQVSNQIAQATHRGAGNFVIGSPIFIAALQMDKSSTFVKADADVDVTQALSYVGTLNGTTKVYSSLFLENDIIVGYKGAGSVDTGYVYSPYVPMTSTGVIIDPTTFTHSIGFITRYGKFAGKTGEFSYSSGRNYYRALTFSSNPEVLLEHDVLKNPEVDQTSNLSDSNANVDDTFQ